MKRDIRWCIDHCFSKLRSREVLHWFAVTVFPVRFNSFIFLKFFWISVAWFVLLEFSEFSTKDKITFHSVTKGVTVIAGQIPESTRSGGQVTLFDASAIIDTLAVLFVSRICCQRHVCDIRYLRAVRKRRRRTGWAKQWVCVCVAVNLYCRLRRVHR